MVGTPRPGPASWPQRSTAPPHPAPHRAPCCQHLGSPCKGQQGTRQSRRCRWRVAAPPVAAGRGQLARFEIDRGTRSTNLLMAEEGTERREAQGNQLPGSSEQSEEQGVGCTPHSCLVRGQHKAAGQPPTGPATHPGAHLGLRRRSLHRSSGREGGGLESMDGGGVCQVGGAGGRGGRRADAGARPWDEVAAGGSAGRAGGEKLRQGGQTATQVDHS